MSHSLSARARGTKSHETSKETSDLRSVVIFSAGHGARTFNGGGGSSTLRFCALDMRSMYAVRLRESTHARNLSEIHGRNTPDDPGRVPDLSHQRAHDLPGRQPAHQSSCVSWMDGSDGGGRKWALSISA